MPLLKALIDVHKYTLIDNDNLAQFLESAGDKILFVTGNPDRNLETNDVAIILPELDKAFQKHFQIGVVSQKIEHDICKRFDIWPTPSLLFINGGALIGAIPKVRDWDEYIKEIGEIIGQTTSLN